MLLKKLNGERMNNKSLVLPILSSVFLTLAFVALLLSQKPKPKSSDATLSQDDFDYTITMDLGTVSSLDLAKYIMEQPNYYWIFDFRPEEDFAEYHIPTSTNISLDQLLKNDLQINHKIYLVDEFETQSIQAYYLLNIRGFYDVHFLKGGIQSWRNEVLFPNINTIDSINLINRTNISRYFGGKISSDESSNRSEIITPTQIKKINIGQIGC